MVWRNTIKPLISHWKKLLNKQLEGNYVKRLSINLSFPPLRRLSEGRVLTGQDFAGKIYQSFQRKFSSSFWKKLPKKRRGVGVFWSLLPKLFPFSCTKMSISGCAKLSENTTKKQTAPPRENYTFWVPGNGLLVYLDAIVLKSDQKCQRLWHFWI